MLFFLDSFFVLVVVDVVSCSPVHVPVGVDVRLLDPCYVSFM